MINGHIDSGYIISAVLVAAAVTFVLRVLPFGLKKALAGSEVLDALSHWIPLGAVALLAIYAVSRIDFSSTHTAVPLPCRVCGDGARAPVEEEYGIQHDRRYRHLRYSHQLGF
ncbi:AzlD domain-containing protein [Rothia dentocariosa]|uniref:AzlD domain-containing protein n=1 Tax=Rothia dentocariosa TaxID=2047 RepID=UPI000DFB4272|nr:AzlD domain-containing protein [Rothia dentocariosa]SUE45199.1 Uncharacterised protein [Rothia dentocariosa]